jgi:ribonuclease D
MTNNNFSDSISKEQIQKLPLGYFKGDIIIVNNEETLKKALEDIETTQIWGFDTETRPSFRKGQKNKMAIIQLANENKAYIFQIKKTGIPERLADILRNPDIKKIGVDIKQDLHKIREYIPGFKPDGFIDIQKIAKEKGIKDLSLRKLAAIILGIRISKRQQLSNWEKTELSPAQKRYAATDAWAAYLIYKKLIK